MRHLRLFLLGFSLLAFLGCGETEDKTEPGKTEGAGTNQPKSTSSGGNTVSAASAKDFSMVPNNTVLLASVRPSEALKSPFFKSLPNQDEIAKGLAEIKEALGTEPSNIARVSGALYPGDGNILPGLMEAAMPQQGPPGAFERSDAIRAPEVEPKLDEVNCDPQPGDAFQPPPQQGGQGMMFQMIKGFIPKVDGAVFIQFNNPVDLNQLLQKLPEERRPQAALSDGVSLQLFANVPVAGGMAVWQPNPTMMVVTLKNDVKDVLNNTGASEFAAQAVAEAPSAVASFQLNFSPLKGLLQFASGMAQGQVEGAEDLPNQLKSLSLFVGLNDGADVNVMIDTTDPKAVENIKAAFDQHYQGLESEVQMVSETLPPGTSEEIKSSAQTVAQELYDSVKSEAKGNQYRLSLRVPPKTTDVIAKVAAEQAKQAIGRNNAKMIGLACHMFHDLYNSFPFPAGASNAPEENRNKLSWRVHILPFIEQEPLYREFKLNEAWDSPHNKALIEKMPDIFKTTDATKPGYTQFVAPKGMGFVVDGDRARRIPDFTDGTSNSIMVLTVAPDKAEIWTKPGGFDIDPTKAAETLGGHPAGFLALFADGFVDVLPGSIEPETLKGLLTISGGETTSRFDVPR
jgi:hypothetical protein